MKKTEQRTKDGQRRERRAWTAEFKQEAVRLLHERRLSGSSVADVARDIDAPEQLRQWAKQLRYAGTGDGAAQRGGGRRPWCSSASGAKTPSCGRSVNSQKK